MTKIIAEVANVHEGEYAYMKTLVGKLINTGVHAIKFQYVIPSEFGDPESENFIELDRLKFTHEEFEGLLEDIPDGFNVFYDVFAAGSYSKVLELKAKHTRLNISGVKLHVTNSMDFDLLQKAAQDFEIVFVSVSGLTAIEIASLVRISKETGIFDKIVLVYGVQNYPTKPESIKINKLSELKRVFGVKVALSDHLDGDNIIASDMISFAYLLGYDFIEKHVTLDRSRRLDDDHAALNVSELEAAIQKLEMLKSTVTDNVLALSDDELDYRNKAKQAIYTSENIEKNTSISTTKIAMKRQEGGDRKFNPLNLMDVLGKNAISTLPVGKRMNFNDVAQSVFGYILVRSGSSRYPNKCYQDAWKGIETLRLLIQRLKKSQSVQKWVLCTTSDASDDGIQTIGESEGLKVIRGTENVYQRLEKAFATTGYPDVLLRITADNVFIDPTHIDTIMPEFLAEPYDYYRHSAVIDGCDFEIIRTEAYRTLENFFTNYKEEAEYMTLYLQNSYFHILAAKQYATNLDFTQYRFTLDYEEDLYNIRNVMSEIGDIHFGYDELCSTLENTKVYQYFSPVNKAFNIKAHKRTLF